MIWENTGYRDLCGRCLETAEQSWPPHPALLSAMNSLPKQALLCEGMASPLLSRDLGVSHCGGHPHSSPLGRGFGGKCPPCALGNHPCLPAELQRNSYANSILGSGFWEPDSSLQLCKRPDNLQYYSDTNMRVNRNNHVKILLLDYVAFLPRPLYLTRCISTLLYHR